MLNSVSEVFILFLRLGLTSFGGPIAHLGYFQNEFVTRRRWLSETDFAELVALCQFLPGPASSQVGFAIGLRRAGIIGGLAAWVGFTLPSALLLILFALGSAYVSPDAVWLHGFKLAAVAVVAQAIWQMARANCKTLLAQAIAVGAGVFVYFSTTPYAQLIVIFLAAVLGSLLMVNVASVASSSVEAPPHRKRLGALALVVYALLLLALPLVANLMMSDTLSLFERLYRVGSLVFGGGHVVLPLLKSEVVNTGFISNERFLIGYGAAQAIPGPLFSLAAFLGAASLRGLSGWAGGLIALVAIFLPGLLLIYGCLPFWFELRKHTRLRAAVLGVNACVVGLLASVFVSPLWTSTIFSRMDLAIAVIGFYLLTYRRVPSWVVVILCVASAAAF